MLAVLFQRRAVPAHPGHAFEVTGADVVETHRQRQRVRAGQPQPVLRRHHRLARALRHQQAESQRRLQPSADQLQYVVTNVMGTSCRTPIANVVWTPGRTPIANVV